ncbi:MAG TPA: hypothetical protein VEI52_05940 [Terriglobales bacterium]|nr:hypothetical protein [Terriglobales bacterium]
MKACFPLFIVLTFALVAPSAYAYGDPTGGSLFQTLGPLLAVVWGLWMILANNIRRLIAKARLKLRGDAKHEQELS